MLIQSTTSLTDLMPDIANDLLVDTSDVIREPSPSASTLTILSEDDEVEYLGGLEENSENEVEFMGETGAQREEDSDLEVDVDEEMMERLRETFDIGLVGNPLEPYRPRSTTRILPPIRRMAKYVNLAYPTDDEQ